MRLRTRKAIGTFATVLFLIVYCLAAMVLGGQVAIGRGMVVELGFYMLAGVLWIPIVMGLIRWMAKPDAT